MKFENLNESPHFKLMNDRPYVGGWKYRIGELFFCGIFNSICTDTIKCC